MRDNESISSQDILAFWFDEIERKFWFSSTPAFDVQIKERFEKTSKTIATQLSETVPHEWENEAETSLALLIALDQFPRNMYRNKPQAFAWDPLAEALTLRMIESGQDLEISEDKRAFVYMPLMHSESLSSQDKCVEMCDLRLNDSSTLFHAKAHRDLILQFGRFPHRNEILGRESTEEERQFLADGGYSP